LKELQAVVGFCNYYRQYVRNYSAVVQPLTRLTQKDVAWHFGDVEKAAFDAVRAQLCQPGNALRRVDYSKRFTLYTDFSN